jgi:hypothetical protein
VGGREASPEAVEAAGAAARENVLRMNDEQARLFGPRVACEALYRDVDAATLFPVPPGMFLTVRTGSSPFVVVIPAAGGWRRTQRYYGIKVPEPDERQACRRRCGLSGRHRGYSRRHGVDRGDGLGDGSRCRCCAAVCCGAERVRWADR